MKAKRIRNVVKDIQRGTGNRVGESASVLGEGRNESDHAHVLRSSPISLKRREIENDLHYQDKAINRTREASTSRKRADKEVKPL